MLLLGGPLHGQERELENDQTEVVIMAPSPGNPLPTPWKYELKEIEAETRPGTVFRRSILVEKSMPIQVATEALASVLMTKFASELVRQFMEGGKLVSSERVNDVSVPGEFSKGGIIIGKR